MTIGESKSRYYGKLHVYALRLLKSNELWTLLRAYIEHVLD